jgi:hypothetical protein
MATILVIPHEKDNCVNRKARQDAQYRGRSRDETRPKYNVVGESKANNCGERDENNGQEEVIERIL